MPARGFELALGFASQKIADAPIDMRGIAGNAKQPLAAAVRLGPNRAARAAAMRDPVRHAAQRNHDPVGERHRLRQPAKPRRDPAAVLLRERARFFQRAARRNREDHFAGRGLDAQRITARLPVPPHAHEIDRPIEDDFDRLRLTRPTIKQRTIRHGRRPRTQPEADCAISEELVVPLIEAARVYNIWGPD